MHLSILSLYLCLSLTMSTAALNNVYELRTKGNQYIAAKQPDSAATYFSKVIEDPVYSNATDFLLLSSCYLQLKDTQNFRTNLVQAIKNGGADSGIIFTYFRRVGPTDYAYFRKYFDSSFSTARKEFLSGIDTALAREMDDILYLDQLVRQSSFSNENLPHIMKIGAYIDSVNYVRVADLIRRNKYPGFHNFGIMSSKYDQILMHISDHSEEQWNFIFDFLKREVLSGNITPTQVVTIATRHYGNKFNCTYYGSIKWGTTQPCDCEKIDQHRAEIGLDNLQAEYSRLKTKLPDCYIK